MDNQPLEGVEDTATGAISVQWSPWTPATFARAQAEDKPLLLSITAVWCYWCHEMDQTTFTDPDVVRYLHQYFVPVRVDNDHRPEVNARYNVGGWPTTAFLTPHGGYLAGATYLPADQLLAMLMEVRRAYQEDKAQFYDQALQLQHQRRDQAARVAAGAALEPQLVDRIGRRVTSAYDVRHGGFGEDIKFPSAPVLQFLLHLYRTTGEAFYRVMLEKSLDNMVHAGLYDGVDGGFYRYSARADWTDPQHEKMLEDNLNLARVYLDAHLLLGQDEYLAVAARTVAYLLTTLYDRAARGFRGSQGAHSAYFSRSAEERRRQTPPAVDPVCYIGTSAQAVSFLLEAHWKLAQPELRTIALSVLDRLSSLAKGGSVLRCFDANGPLGDSSRDWLGDWAYLLNALVDGYGADASREDYRSQAVDIAQRLLDQYYDGARGGFFDLPSQPDSIGYLRVREKPLPENVAAVLGLMKLHQISPNSAYQRAAEQTLSAYVEANRDYGEPACSYAVAVDRFLNPPVEITVEGATGCDGFRQMCRAAARVTYPHVVVRVGPGNGASADSMDNDTADIEIVGGTVGPALAHICVNNQCLPPVADPTALERAVSGAVSPPANPAASIFERFTGI